jgi:hypothetical protein
VKLRILDDLTSDLILNSCLISLTIGFSIVKKRVSVFILSLVVIMEFGNMSERTFGDLAPIVSMLSI